MLQCIDCSVALGACVRFLVWLVLVLFASMYVVAIGMWIGGPNGQMRLVSGLISFVSS